MANLLERVEELHRRVTELEQRVPKPIPVVEPWSKQAVVSARFPPTSQSFERQGQDALRIEAIEREMVPQSKPIPVVEPLRVPDRVVLPGGVVSETMKPQPCCEWQERAERAEALVAEFRERITDLLATEGTLGSFRAREQVRDLLARARVAKAVP